MCIRDSLKVGYNKVYGYYIEVTKSNTDQVPDEYIRKQTLVNAERYITPELKEYETLVLNAEERIREMCIRDRVEGDQPWHRQAAKLPANSPKPLIRFLFTSRNTSNNL